jgi:hypothetical protein
VQQQYLVLAPKLHDLLTQVQQQQQSGEGGTAARSRGRRRAGNAGRTAGSFAESPAAVVLLRALRCLQLWESRQITQPEMPAMLQRLAGVGSSAAAAATAGEVEVEEVIDLTAHDDDSSMAVLSSWQRSWLVRWRCCW